MAVAVNNRYLHLIQHKNLSSCSFATLDSQIYLYTSVTYRWKTLHLKAVLAIVVWWYNLKLVVIELCGNGCIF